jgi:hypothetical protein
LFRRIRDRIPSTERDISHDNVLGYPRQREQLTVDTDASSVGIAGVLSYVQNGSERVVTYFSKILSKSDSSIVVGEFEVYRIFHKYLCGQQVHLRTEHSALPWLLSVRNLEGQTVRWVQRLQKCNFKSQNHKGTGHTIRDYCSRRYAQRSAYNSKVLNKGQAAYVCI